MKYILIAFITVLSLFVVARPIQAAPRWLTSDQIIDLIAESLSPIYSSLDLIHQEISLIQETLSTLAARVDTIENKEEDSSSFLDVTWFEEAVTRNQITFVVDAKEYTNVTFTYHCIDNEAAISIQVSSDQENWVNQFLAVQSQCKAGGTVSMPTAGRYYRVGTSMDHSSSVTINAFSRFSK